MQFLELDSRIRNAKALEFGYILDNSIDLFKKVWLKGFAVVLILAILAIGLAFFFEFIGLGPNDTPQNSSSVFNAFNIPFFDFSFSMELIYTLPQTMMVSFVSTGLVAGFYRICKQVDLNEKETDEYFYFFSADHIGKVLYLGVIYAVIATLAQILFLLPYIYVVIPLSFFSVILAFNPELTEMEIVRASFNLGNKKWLITFGTLLICGILGMLGIILCGFGVLFTISIMYLPVYFIYKESVGLDQYREIEQIGEL